MGRRSHRHLQQRLREGGLVIDDFNNYSYRNDDHPDSPDDYDQHLHLDDFVNINDDDYYDIDPDDSADDTVYSGVVEWNKFDFKFSNNLNTTSNIVYDGLIRNLNNDTVHITTDIWLTST